MNRSQERHDQMIHYFYNNPTRLFQDPVNVLSVSMEYSCYRNGQLYVVPDLYITTRRCDYFFELKSTNTSKTLSKGRKQINRMCNWLIENQNHNTSQLGLVYPRHSNLEDVIIELFTPK